MGWTVQFLPDTQTDSNDEGSTQLESVLSRLWDLGTTGIGELGSGHIVAGFETSTEVEVAADFLRTQTVVSEIECQPLDTTSWHDPDKVSDVTVPTASGEISFSLKAGPSFGHGEHETTKLILNALSEHLQPGESVLDLGTGSGVLAIAAKRLAAGEVKAIDIDPEAVAIAVANATANNVAVDASATPVADLAADHPGHFDLILANVLAVAHRDVAPSVLKLLTPQGRVITSGYLPGQVNDVAQAYHPLASTKILKLGPWSGNVFSWARSQA